MYLKLTQKLGSGLAVLWTQMSASKKVRQKKMPSGLLILAFLVSSLTAFQGSAQMTNFSYGFESAPGANDWSQNISVVSGTNGINAASGGNYGSVPLANANNDFTRFGAYNSVFPCSGYKTSLKIYLDVNGGWANDTRVDYTSAVNNTSGSHRRDFIFHIGFYNDATGLGANTNRFIIGGSNNAPGNPKGSGQFIISTTGWYTFEHHFKNVAGALSVDFTVYDAVNAVVGTFTINSPTDLIPSIVGGNRYGWVINNAFSPLAIDDVTLTVNPGGSVTNTNTSTTYCSIQAAIDAPATLNGHTLAVTAGTYAENITINKDLVIQGPNAGTAGNGTRVAEAIIADGKVSIMGANTVVFDGFTIAHVSNSTPISLGGGAVATIQNNIITRNGTSTVPGGPTSARGIEISAGAGVKNISSNLFTGDATNLFSGTLSWNSGMYINAAGSTINVTGNVFQNCRTGLNIDDMSAGISLSGNTFSNSGTYISFGGTSPSTGSHILGANEFNTAVGTVLNLSNVATSFRLDVSAGTYGGVSFSALPLNTMFGLELRTYHRGRYARNGMVIYVPNNLHVVNYTGAGGPIIDNINTAISYASPGNIINLQDGSYNQRIVVDKSLTFDGQSEAGTILDGTGLVGPGSGIYINNGITNVTIEDLTVQNFAGTSPNSYAGIYGVGGNNNLTVQNATLKNNVGGSGFYANGPVDNVLLDNLDVSGHTNAFGAARGIVIWNGLKSNITVTNCEVYNNNCCGIELQDGTASGVTMSNNNIHDNGDNGIGIVGMQGAGENLISGNTLLNNGRFGIEIKNPNGSGLATGAGRIVVENNNVSRNVAIGDARDIAGIIVMRRGVLAGNVDVPNGVVVQNNTVAGYVQPSTSDGFGIVIEGTNHTVSGNNVSGSDVGIQRQAGHTPYPGDGNQTDIADTYFGRGNSPVTCGVTISGSIFASNGVNTRDVPASVGSGIVTNVNTSTVFCSIQAAIDAPTTLNGHTIVAGAGTYPEMLTINKDLTINGPNAGTAGNGTRVAEAIISDGKVSVMGGNTVVFDGFKIYETNDISAISLGGGATVTIQNNIIERFGVNAGIQTARGIEISAGAGVKTIANNLFTGDASGGLFGGHKTWQSGLYVNCAGSTVNITGNVFEKCRAAMNLDDMSAGISVSGNTFTNNGTFISFGGTSPTSGSYTLGANEYNTLVSGFMNLSNVTSSFRLDISAGTFGGVAFSALPLATLFNIEGTMFHRTRSGRLGLVYYVPNHQYVLAAVNNSIQTAIDYAAVGNVINVQAGTYAQIVNITKGVEMRGPNNLISPNGGVRVPEAIITGGISVDNAASKIVIIEGFRFQGVTSPMVYNGNGPAIIVADLTFRKNIVDNSSGQLAVDLGTATNSAIVVLDDNNFAGMSGNAIQLNGGTGVLNATVTNNNITGTGTAGINTNGISASTFDGNTISNTAQQAIQVAGTASNVTISNNVITNANTSNAADRGGIRLRGGSLTGFVSITNNIISGSNNGIALPAPDDVTGKSINVNNNNLAGNTVSINHFGTGNLAATCNWYGTANLATVATKIAGPVTYQPMLTSGTDTDVAIGFQPGAGTCQTVSAIVVNGTATNDDCSVVVNGSIDITVTGGVAPFTYAWDNAAVTEDLTNLGPGSYNVVVTDAFGNTGSNGFSIVTLAPTVWFRDVDGDGKGTPNNRRTSCPQPFGFVANDDDCNDNDATIFTGAPELCDGKDNDCDGTIDDGLTQTTWYRDQDGDGYGRTSWTKVQCGQPGGFVAASGDCDDLNSAVNPAATEVCDGIDNDCDGIKDEGCSVLWFRDVDKDGRGNPNVSVLAVVKPNGYVANSNDCKDNDNTIYLGAPELCDGKDNDCDGTVDDGFAVTTWYRDQDGDQFGKTSWTKVQCPQPSGFVAASGDCNDTDPTIYPGAPELCDGKDNDCVAGGRDLGCPVPPAIVMQANAGKELVKAEVAVPEVTLYPNPARDEIVVTINGFEAGKKVEMQLMQADGKAVLAQSLVPSVPSQQVRLDVRKMTSGYYLLQVKQGITQQTKKVMIVR